ncbi:hypothetical protein [Halostagnicola kamekurae]|uniref:hypothetical protein n=1 Tax=Halostagnicola kamekurae TaxID=619731 RepID=UPI001587A5E3|nr:hypothetical protein [Halostagnicola kamekurae]
MTSSRSTRSSSSNENGNNRIERITDGGHPLEESSLQTLCADCHSEKTVDENSGRVQH